MRKVILVTSLFLALASHAQQTENLIIITTDGFRWQELFTGMDTAIANNRLYNQGDSLYMVKKYWAEDPAVRRKLLMPFLWGTVVSKGQIYGNRLLGNNVNVSNPYKFSYPGYSEIMCGFVDTLVNSNEYKANPNTTVLEFFNKQPKLKGRIAAFTAWEAFNRILNEERSGIPVVAAYDLSGGKNPTANHKLLNSMLTNSHKEWKEECMDIFTHQEAIEELQTKKPRVLYISYGETDEWAHGAKYSYYLDAAQQLDSWIKQIWEMVQADPQYRNKTSLLITTDHGRGDLKTGKWTSHGASVNNADQIWFAVMGPNTPAGGEMKAPMQIYQKQFAQTAAKLMGYTYKAEHPVADEIKTAIK